MKDSFLHRYAIRKGKSVRRNFLQVRELLGILKIICVFASILFRVNKCTVWDCDRK